MSNVYPSQARTYHAEVLPDSPYHSPHDGPPRRPTGSKGVLWLILGCGGTLLLLMCGGGVVGGFFSYRILAAEKPGIDAELMAFFDNLKSKDLDAAYTHFSATAKRKQTKQQFVAVLKNPPWQSFDEYESYRTTGIRVFFGKPVAPGEASATTATVNGIVRLKDGRGGSFNAVLEKQGDQWRIFAINTNVPPASK